MFKKAKTRNNLLAIVFAVVLFLSACLLMAENISVQKTGLGNGSSAIYSKDVAAFAEQLAAGSTTDREKAEAFYSWICENIDYNPDDGTVIMQTVNLDRVLAEKEALCYGYSNLFAAMCRSQGIPCYVVDGEALDGSGARHSWNVVKIDGTLYSVDTTSDAYALKHGTDLFGFHEVSSAQEDDLYKVTKVY